MIKLEEIVEGVKREESKGEYKMPIRNTYTVSSSEPYVDRDYQTGDIVELRYSMSMPAGVLGYYNSATGSMVVTIDLATPDARFTREHEKAHKWASNEHAPDAHATAATGYSVRHFGNTYSRNNNA